MRSGVSKSGSPAPKEITFTPRARSSLALACTARVDDGARSFRRSASTGSSSSAGSGRRFRRELLRQALLNDRWDQPGDRRAVAGDLLDKPRGDVGVLLVGHEEPRLDGARQLAVHEGHLEFVLEVRDGADAAHDAVG